MFTTRKAPRNLYHMNLHVLGAEHPRADSEQALMLWCTNDTDTDQDHFTGWDIFCVPCAPDQRVQIPVLPARIYCAFALHPGEPKPDSDMDGAQPAVPYVHQIIESCPDVTGWKRTDS